MKSSKSFLFITVFAVALAAQAEPSVDMNDMRRAVGREDDVRVDAQLTQETLTPGTPIAVTYQIQNMTDSAVAVADKICEASYDADTLTVTLAVGSEVPPDGAMPRMTVIGPEEKKTFTAAAHLHVVIPSAVSGRTAGPRYVRIKVSILRDLVPFRALIEQQSAVASPPLLDDQQFEKWLKSNDTIFLNSIPVRYNSRRRSAESDASQRHMSRSF